MNHTLTSFNIGMPFGQLPVLEWKGQMLPQVDDIVFIVISQVKIRFVSIVNNGRGVKSQSGAINRFLAHRHGLGGENEWDGAQIDAYVALMNDATERNLYYIAIIKSIIS